MYCRNHDNGHVRILVPGPLQQTDAIQVGHHQVRQYEVEMLTRVKQGQCFHVGSCLFAGISGSTEHGGDDFPNRFFVVNYKNAL